MELLNQHRNGLAIVPAYNEERLVASVVEAIRVRAGLWTLLVYVPNLNLAAVLLVGGYGVIHGLLSIGGLVAFISYLFMLNGPMDALGWILSMGEEARTASDRLDEVYDSEPDIVDRPGAGALPQSSGRVTLDGVDIRDLTLSSLRGHLGVAFEDPILFSASVRENLLMGRPEAADEEIFRALDVAQAGFVRELPWGLDTRVGEQGYSLSGGQRQRLALARAVLGRPQVLILDDPLSSVDVHTEALIEEALASVLEGVTALLVVHRPSTLALADRVALVEGGTITAVGTHHALMEDNPVYRALLSQEAEERAS